MIYLETERLVLRDWREEDSVVFSRMNRDPKVMEYFLKPLTDTESRDFYERIRREIDTFGWGLFAAEVKISGKFIGYIGLHHTNFETDFCPCIEIGWRLCENLLGTGIATEGAPGLSGLCFQAITTTGDLFLYFFTQQTLRKGNAKDRIAKNRGVRSSVGSLPDIRCSGMYFIGLKKGKAASSIMISQSLIRILTGT